MAADYSYFFISDTTKLTEKSELDIKYITFFIYRVFLRNIFILNEYLTSSPQNTHAGPLVKRKLFLRITGFLDFVISVRLE
jgi:hypothetical protein